MYLLLNYADMEKALKSSVYKRELLMFLKDEWTSLTYAPHELHFVIGQDCFLYTVHDGIVNRKQVF